jgi:hypothetical protein
VTALLVLVLSSGVLAWHHVDPQGVAWFTGRELRPTTTATSGVRLAFPSLTVAPDPNHHFVATQPGSSDPVTFDPCRPIHYVVRPGGELPEGDELIADAFARITAASGLVFVDDGVTTEGPSPTRPNFQPERYGDRWAPVLVAWSGPQELPRLSGEVIGLTSSQPVLADDGQLALVSGQVALDAAQLADVVRFNGGRAVAIATITHELGHLVGLAHVDDPRQLMYPRARSVVSTFGKGDLTGLAALGNGTCHDEL